MAQDSTAPDSEGIKVKIAVYDGDTLQTEKIIGHLDSIDSLEDSSRSEKKYTPLNSKDYEEIVALGAASEAPVSMGVLYDPEADEGINDARIAYRSNKKVQIIIEVDNPLNDTGTGTIYKQDGKLSKFKVGIEAEGKLKAEITISKLGAPEIVAATAGA